MRIDLNDGTLHNLEEMKAYENRQHNALRVPVPFLGSETGLGDAIGRVTEALGVKPGCGGCGDRAQALNNLTPWSWG
jgi:hypothetical protein